MCHPARLAGERQIVEELSGRSIVTFNFSSARLGEMSKFEKIAFFEFEKYEY